VTMYQSWVAKGSCTACLPRHLVASLSGRLCLYDHPAKLGPNGTTTLHTLTYAKLQRDLLRCSGCSWGRN
jgi:hypothetical protein